jgi:putative oxygen-independent coproporphyrinogen III oxidase
LSQVEAGDPPLAVYVHWPYCARICPYCDFNVVRDRGQAEHAALARAIVADLHGQAAMIGARRLVSIFLGGGTPSLMDPAWAAAIIAEARALWPADGALEITLEANPTDAEADRFRAFAAAGVNRLSLGVQSLDDEALRFLGRNHSADEARRAIDLAASQFPRLSIDLIYALPGQALADWTAALRLAAGLGAEHVSAYQLTIEPGTPFDRAVTRKRFTPPDAEQSASLYETAQAILAEAGFDAYEVSNHARTPAARSRHNLAYWRGEDYLGAGPGAHGRLTLPDGRIATEADPKVAGYIARVQDGGSGLAGLDLLQPRDVAIERLLMGLRTDEGVAWNELGALGLGPGSPAVTPLAESGLVTMDPERLMATRRGRAVLDSLVAALIPPLS